jgi:hypothetical protein
MRLLVIVGSLIAISSAQAQSQIVSAGYDIPEFQTVAAGQVVTLFVRGLKVPDAFATGTQLPTALAGLTVRAKSDIQNYPDRLPIFSVRSYKM